MAHEGEGEPGAAFSNFVEIEDVPSIIDFNENRNENRNDNNNNNNNDNNNNNANKVNEENKEKPEENKNPEENKDQSNETDLKLKAIPEYENLSFKTPKESFIFMASIKAPYYRPLNRASIDLVCIIDESGSMAGDRIALVKETLTFIVNNLESKDNFGLIGYSNKGREILSLTRMDEAGKKLALVQVNQLRAQGGTALCEGLVMGISMLKRNAKSSSNIASCMLFTDGKANMGPINLPDIIKRVEALNVVKIVKTPNYTTPRLTILQQGEQDDNSNNANDSNNNEEDFNNLSYTINTFGFSEGHNAKLLQGLSEYGKGMYVYIDNVNLIAETFAECLGGLISTVGKNIKLRIEIDKNNNVLLTKCLTQGYIVKIIEANKKYEILIPDIQSEENKDILFSLNIPKIDNSTKAWNIGKISLNYNNISTNINDQSISTNITLDRLDNDIIGERDANVDLQYNRVVVSQALNEADEKAEQGKLEEAKFILNRAQKIVDQSKTNNYSYTQNLLQDIVESNENLSSKDEYLNIGSKKMKEKSKAHGWQRSTHSSVYASQQNYTNAVKQSMISKFKK